MRTTDLRVEAKRFIFAAGAGNGKLAAAAGAATRMQRLPLKQVLVHRTNPEPIFAHCITGMHAEPALTITTLPVLSLPRWRARLQWHEP